jgi:FixJ family two-component response regulator
MTTTPLIHIVDDDQAIRSSLRRLLTEAGFEVRVYGSTGEFLLEPLPERPGCLLLDVRLPGPSGLELQAALERQKVGLPVIFLTGYADVASSVRAMKAGAVDFLEKPVAPDILFASIQSAIVRDMSRRAAQQAEDSLHERLVLLSAGERDVFDRVVVGKLNKEIAHELGISERTVKTRRAHIMTKLGASSVAELGAQAAQMRRRSGGERTPKLD